MPTGSPSGAEAETATTILTVGHSNRPASEFLELLRAHGVQRLIDVRTFPGSRRNPQFDAETLSRALEAAGIEYRHEPELGGLRRPSPDSLNTGWKNPGFRAYADHMQSDAFRDRLGALVESATPGTVLMCAEAVPWRCHRSLLSDALLARGIEVRHIIGPKQREHTISPHARVQDGRVAYPALL